MKRSFWLGVALLTLAGVSFAVLITPSCQSKTPPVATVTHVDLARYTGKWYEIAAIPMFFERNCVANTTAEYSQLPNGLIRVLNSCETKEGKRISSEGRAKVVDRTTQAKLKVTFLNFLGWRFIAGGDYWILDLDAAPYSYAIIGHPSRKYGWILSRTPSLPKATLQALANTLKQQGYDPCQFITMPQTGGLQTKTPLCQSLQ